LTTELLSKLILSPGFGPTWTLRLVFMANVMRRMTDTVDNGLLADARDSIENREDRRLLNYILGLGTPPNVMEDQGVLGLETEGITKERIIALLRPDPRMLIEVQRVDAPTDPPCEVYQVVVEDGRGGSWNEAFASEPELQAFLRGIRCTFAMSDLNRMLPDLTGLDAGAPLRFTEQSTVQHLA
jgi:hypothetical protein